MSEVLAEQVAQGRAAAFLDRDGVLNVDFGHVGEESRLEWVSGAREAVLKLNQAGLLVVVVSNQSGIARGMYAEDDFWKLARRMERDLAQIGASIDAWYFCPHHPDFTGDCDCRKPKPGMLDRAILDLGIDRARSFMIGDADTDGVAARAAGVGFFLFRDDDLSEFLDRELALG